VNWDEMAVVGRVARPHGIRGQIVVNPETDFPEDRFSVGSTVFVSREGRVEPLMVTVSRIQQGRPVIAIEGIADPEAARALAGLELRVPVESLVPLPEGQFYRHELIGCAVETADGRQVGTVSDVEGDTTNSRLVVQAERGEVLIPLAVDICTTIDTAAKRIVIAPPSGLLEVNEPRG
jgi:16S rRNA processing protein RimM